MQKAVRNGWPIFVGRSGGIADAAEQFRVYRDALANSNHPPDVVAECLRWCTVDWLSVVVADTDAEAQRRFAAARGEMIAMRQSFAQRYHAIHGPLSSRHGGAGAGSAAAFAAGGDMDDAIVGSPETVAKQVRALADAGINHILLRFVGEWVGETRWISEDSMKLFAREVAPRFSTAGVAATS
jgi:alkanesulfonate monooxygenase SsuD/methylene tetrahydromethanopterin reductase-like flavin-dependent oxidoreductase (luciferase family)